MLNAGDKFGDWKVISNKFLLRGKYQQYYACECKCGFKKYIRKDNLINGTSKSCQNCSRKKQAVVSNTIKIGDIYGDWTILSLPYARQFTCETYHRYCLCRCKCGVEKEISVYRLINGKTHACRSCGKKRKA